MGPNYKIGFIELLFIAGLFFGYKPVHFVLFITKGMTNNRFTKLVSLIYERQQLERCQSTCVGQNIWVYSNTFHMRQIQC